MRRDVTCKALLLACAAVLCRGAAAEAAAAAAAAPELKAPSPDIWGFMNSTNRLTWNSAAIAPPAPGQLSRDLTAGEKAIIMQAAPAFLASDEPLRDQMLLTARFKLPALIYDVADGSDFSTIYCGLRTVRTAYTGYSAYQFAVTLRIEKGVVVAASNPQKLLMTDEAQTYVRGSYCSSRHYNLDAAYDLPDDQPPAPLP